MNSTSFHPEPIAGFTVCYTCMNNMRTIPASHDSIRDLADTLIVLDSGSTDGTIEYFRDQGIETVHRDFTNPTEQKEYAMSLASEARWILLLDSDESLNQEAVQSIRDAISNCPDSVCGFELNRFTWLNGHLLEHSFQPEWRLRLVRAGTSRIVGDSVGGHDRVEVDGDVRRLDGRILHDSWTGTRDMLERGLYFGFRGAPFKKGGRRLNILFNPAVAFFKQLILRQGFRDGWRGWIAAGGVASYVLAKHLAIMERRELEREERKSS